MYTASTPYKCDPNVLFATKMFSIYQIVTGSSRRSDKYYLSCKYQDK